MWSHMVVVISLGRDNLLDIIQNPEPMLIETGIAEVLKQHVVRKRSQGQLSSILSCIL